MPGPLIDPPPGGSVRAAQACLDHVEGRGARTPASQRSQSSRALPRAARTDLPSGRTPAAQRTLSTCLLPRHRGGRPEGGSSPTGAL
jgi:hypothetical protein